LILGTVREKAGDPEAGKFIDLALRVWKASRPDPFDVMLARRRSWVAPFVPD
jgi:hypothetical protein